MPWREIFELGGTKRISHNDMHKHAYVLNRVQYEAIVAVKGPPKAAEEKIPIEVTVLDLESRTSRVVVASYYESKRSEAANRKPEPRLGQDLVTNVMEEGQNIYIGCIGTEIFAVLNPPRTELSDKITAALASKRSLKDYHSLMFRRVAAAGQYPTTSRRFRRDSRVVAFAILRAGGRCEMPGCAHSLFLNDRNERYLEVHHVHWLREGGSDSWDNVAALCPSCHREVHFGKRRVQQTQKLMKAVDAKNAALEQATGPETASSP
ncbi:MAG: HNH endonuclease signature motif containing protein [Spirochaetales bacterium]